MDKTELIRNSINIATHIAPFPIFFSLSFIVGEILKRKAPMTDYYKFTAGSIFTESLLGLTSLLGLEHMPSIALASTAGLSLGTIIHASITLSSDENIK